MLTLTLIKKLIMFWHTRHSSGLTMCSFFQAVTPDEATVISKGSSLSLGPAGKKSKWRRNTSQALSPKPGILQYGICLRTSFTQPPLKKIKLHSRLSLYYLMAWDMEVLPPPIFYRKDYGKEISNPAVRAGGFSSHGCWSMCIQNIIHACTKYSLQNNVGHHYGPLLQGQSCMVHHSTNVHAFTAQSFHCTCTCTPL